MKKRILSLFVVAFMFVLSSLNCFAADMNSSVYSDGGTLANSNTYAQPYSAPALPDYEINRDWFETSESTLISRLTNDMTQHYDTIYGYYKTDHIVTSDEVIGWLDVITRDTPNTLYEGDYLLWSFDPTTSQFGIFYDVIDGDYYNVIVLQLSFYTTPKQEITLRPSIMSTVDSFGFTNESSLSEKLQVIYEYLCDITVVPLSKGESNPILNSAYSAQFNKKATPLGVAALTRLMLGEINIYSRIIPGYVNDTPHFWNIGRNGKYEGEYYNIDIAADCGKADYAHYFKGGDDFDNYQRLDEYNDSAFRTKHPMSSADFSFLAVEQGTFGDGMAWYFYPDRSTLVLRGNGRMPDFDGDAPWSHLKDSIENIKLVDDISYIGARSFEGYPNLRKVTMGSGIKEIGPYAFRNCIALGTVTLTGYPQRIDDGAFMNCTHLYDFNFRTYDLETIGDDAFRNTGISSVWLSARVETIGERAFMDCASLKNFEFEGNLYVTLTINADALSGTSLTRMIVERDVILKENAFRGSNITELIFDDNVISIASNAFSDVEATICYRNDRSGWLSAKDKNYGGSLNWVELFYGNNSCPGGIPMIISETPSTCQEHGTINCEVYCYDCGYLLKSYSEYADLAPHKDSNDDEACDWCGTYLCRTHTLVTTPGTAPTCTEPGTTDSVYCTACEYVQSFAKTIPPTGHNYVNHVCTNCGMISNPFVDVAEKDYFFEPVLWAVQKGITGGISATQFAPNNACTRGQVVTFLWRAAGSPEPQSTSHPFTDISENQYYFKAVLWAVENGITSGLTATTFGPNNACTRGQIATFLWRANGSPEPQSSNNPFSDVNAGPFYKAILWAVEEGITTGYAGGTFRPGNVCTRGNIVTFLYRAYN